MRKHIKIGISGINPLNGNRGVGALAISTIYLLKKIAKDNELEIEIIAINPNYGNHLIDIGSERIDIKNILPVSIFGLKNLIKLFTTPKLIFSLKEYPKFDLMLCMGEGDSFSDIYGLNRFKSINDQHRMARLFRKSYVLLPQTIGPYKNEKVKKQANKSIEKAVSVFARDFQSYQYVTKDTKQKQVFESIDVAFFMPYKKQKFSKNYIHVGLNISSLLWHGGYTQNNQFGLKCDYQKLIRDIINYFLTLPDVKIHIVPHVVSLNSDIENDYEVSFNLVKEYNNERIILAPFFLNPILAKNYIAGLDFFAGARMHSTIAAFSSGVPVFPIAYSRKFNGLFKDTLDYPYMGDLVNEEMEDIIEGIKNAYNKREDLAEIIQERMNGIVKDREELFLNKLGDILCKS